MVEIFEPQIEKIEEKGIDWNFLKRRQKKYKGAKGIILGDLMRAKNDKNWEMAKYLEDLLTRVIFMETQEKIVIESWKGKSGISLIEHPDRFICITYKKMEKGEKPKEMRKEILKEDLNKLIVVLNSFKNKLKIPTKEIAEKLYKKSWQEWVYGHRDYHISLVYMLNILEQKKLINYSRRGFTTILNQLRLF